MQPLWLRVPNYWLSGLTQSENTFLSFNEILAALSCTLQPVTQLDMSGFFVSFCALANLAVIAVELATTITKTSVFETMQYDAQELQPHSKLKAT